MRISTNPLVLALIAALIIGGIYTASTALAGPARQAAASTPGTSASTAQAAPTQKPTPVPPGLVRVWSSMCVEGVPYTLLSVPTDAKFASVVPEGQMVSPAMTSVPVTGASGSMTPQASIGSAVPPTGATGALGQVPIENSCTALGMESGVQLVICTGPQGHAFRLYVHSGSGTQIFNGTLWDCTAHKAPSTSLTTTPMSVLATLPSGTLPPTATPTTPPATPTP